MLAQAAELRAALVVDDDAEMCWVLKVALELAQRSVTVAQTGRQALALVTERSFPIAFVDARLPDMNGLQLATEMIRIDQAMRIILISGYYSADDQSIVEAMTRRQVHGFLAKPFEISTIIAAARADD